MKHPRSLTRHRNLVLICSALGLGLGCSDEADSSPPKEQSDSGPGDAEQSAAETADSSGAESNTDPGSVPTDVEDSDNSQPSEASEPESETSNSEAPTNGETDSDSTEPGTSSNDSESETATTEASDDSSGESETTSGPPLGDVTWYQQVAPLVSEHCSGCHTAGGIAPFTLDSYEAAVPWASTMVAAVESGEMPPWDAKETDTCKQRFPWKDDLRLGAEEIELLRAWAEGGALEGDPLDAAELPPPPALALPNPDLSLAVTTPVEISGTQDQFLCFSIPTDLADDAWISATQIVPGNTKILHHALTYLDENGDSAELADENGRYDCFGGPGVSGAKLIGAWAPGGVAWRTPPDVAMSLPQGARVIMNLHYHPTGISSETDDSTHLQLEFATEAPKYEGSIALIGNFEGANLLGGLQAGPNDPEDGVEFRIPAGAQGHTETMTFRVPPTVPEAWIWAVGTHMHYVGTDMSVRLAHASPAAGEPDEECLLETPEWDFDWQRGYLVDAPFDDLPRARSGDLLTLSCTYDNSMNNAKVAEALEAQGLSEPRDVVLGENTLDEMCLGAFGIATLR